MCCNLPCRLLPLPLSHKGAHSTHLQTNSSPTRFLWLLPWQRNYSQRLQWNLSQILIKAFHHHTGKTKHPLQNMCTYSNKQRLNKLCLPVSSVHTRGHSAHISYTFVKYYYIYSICPNTEICQQSVKGFTQKCTKGIAVKGCLEASWPQPYYPQALTTCRRQNTGVRQGTWACAGM